MRNTFDDIYDTDRLCDIVDRTCTDLASVEFDTIVGKGQSGAIVIPIIALRMGKRFAIARTDGRVQGDIVGKVLIIDDWISSGTTVNFLLSLVPDAIGIYLYAYGKGKIPAGYLADKIGATPIL